MATYNATHAGLNYSPGRMDVNETYGDIISGGYNPPYAGYGGVYVALVASGTTNKFARNSHGYMSPDIGGLPDGAVIDSATFQWSPSSKDSSMGAPDFHVYFSPFVAPYGTTQNYTNWDVGAILIDTIAFSAISTSSANEFTLPSSVISEIQDAVDSGYAFFGGISIVNSWEVAGSFGGTWHSGSYTDVGATSDSAFSVLNLEIEYHQKHSVSITGTMRTDATVTRTYRAKRSITGAAATSGRVLLELQATQVIDKEYVFKVYDSSGAYLGSWLDVQGDPTFSHRVNEVGSTMDLQLARSPERRKAVTELLHTEGDEVLLTEDGEDILITTNETVTFGENTDVDLGYQVDVWVFYGSNELWLTESSEIILTEDNEEIYLGTGAPNGRRIFSGIVTDYSARYGAREIIDVRLASNGWKLSRAIHRDGSNTDVSYASVDPADIFRDILDTYAGSISYTTASIDDTATTVSYDYTLTTILDALNKALELCPPDWYYYVGLGDNTLYLKEKGTTADHVFTLGKEIQELQLSKSIEDLVNTVYFVGGDTGSGRLYKKYTDATSISEWGTLAKTIVDLSVTTATGAQIQSENFIIDRLKDPRYTSELTINSGVYDIETIAVGQSIGFRNFNNFVDTLILQVVALSYSRDKIILTLDHELPQQRNRIEDIKRNQQKADIDGIGSAPS